MKRIFINQSQVGYMLNTRLNINKAFREQVEESLALVFSSKIMMPIRKVLRKDSTCIISLLMFYENLKNIIFKVLS